MTSPQRRAFAKAVINAVDVRNDVRSGEMHVGKTLTGERMNADAADQLANALFALLKSENSA